MIREIAGARTEVPACSNYETHSACADSSTGRETYMNHKLANVVVLIAALVSLGSQAFADSFTSDQIVALVSTQAIMFDVTAVAFANRQPLAGEFGDWSGSVTSSGWNLNFLGNLSGTSLSFNQIGTLDLVNQNASWTVSGSFGNKLVNGSGSVVFGSSGSWTWTETLNVGTTQENISGSQVASGMTFLRSESADAGVDGLVNFVSTIQNSGPVDVSTHAVANQGNLDVKSSVKQTQNKVDGKTSGTDNPDTSVGTGTTNVAIVPSPEPGTLIMMGSGILGLAGTLRRKINL